jgi:signal transduction histidine kinase
VTAYRASTVGAQVSSVPLGTAIRIDVYDTGIGIPDEQLPKIFEAFARLDNTRREGLGIGLFIVRQAIGLLGHRIDVASTPGRGSRFSIFATHVLPNPDFARTEQHGPLEAFAALKTGD